MTANERQQLLRKDTETTNEGDSTANAAWRLYALSAEHGGLSPSLVYPRLTPQHPPSSLWVWPCWPSVPWPPLTCVENKPLDIDCFAIHTTPKPGTRTASSQFNLRKPWVDNDQENTCEHERSAVLPRALLTTLSVRMCEDAYSICIPCMKHCPPTIVIWLT